MRDQAGEGGQQRKAGHLGGGEAHLGHDPGQHADVVQHQVGLVRRRLEGAVDRGVPFVRLAPDAMLDGDRLQPFGPRVDAAEDLVAKARNPPLGRAQVGHQSGGVGSPSQDARGLPGGEARGNEAAGILGRDGIFAGAEHRGRQAGGHPGIDRDDGPRRDGARLLQCIVQDRGQDHVHHPRLARCGDTIADQQKGNGGKRQATDQLLHRIAADEDFLGRDVADGGNPVRRSAFGHRSGPR
jgi:hypothetical protein